MVALTFSQIADVASSLAWQLTLTLLHILWIGAAISALTIFVDRVLARSAIESAVPASGSANTQARYWLNMVTLAVLAAALPVTFLIVRDSARESETSISRPIAETDDLQLLNTIADAKISHSENDKIRKPFGKSAAAQPAHRVSTVARSEKTSAPLLETFLNQLRAAAPAIAIVYLVGVLAMLIRLAVALCGGQRLTSLGKPAEEKSIAETLTAQAERLALKAVPMVAYCERVAVPVVVGFFKPVILLPATMMTGLSSRELAIVLAHELAHVKRFDHILIVAQRLLEATLFFHPAVWWLGRRINDLREQACDDLVIQSGTNRMDYARSLLRVAELRVGDDARAAQLAQLAIDGGTPSKLRQRIQRIVQSNDEPGVRLNQSRATFALVASAMAIALSLIPIFPANSDRQVDAADGPVPAEDGTSTDQQTASDKTSKEQPSVKQKLKEPADLHVEEMPLIQVLDTVEKLSGVPVTVDLGDFRMRGVDPQMPITLYVEDATVQALFNQIVQQAHLTFEIRPNGVLIPAETPALEFRIVPGLPESDAEIRVPRNWDKSHYRDGTVKGMGPAKDKGFAWFPIQKKKSRIRSTFPFQAWLTVFRSAC